MANTSETTGAAPPGQRPFLHGVDGRTTAARRLRDIRAALLARFPKPNLYIVTLVESLACVQLQLETERCRQANGAAIDNSALVKLANTQRRLSRDLALAEDDDAQAQRWSWAMGAD